MDVPTNAPDTQSLLEQIRPERLKDLLLDTDVARRSRAAVGGRYFHWDDLRRRPAPEGLEPQEFWLLLKLNRQMGMKPLPFVDRDGRPFQFMLADAVQEGMARIDSLLSGSITLSEPVTEPETRDRYLVSSLMEEAISSSLLEGAATTYKEAKELLRTGRPPRSTGELMVANNFRAMQFIRECRDDDLTPEIVLELHRVVTAGTLDDPTGGGRYRRADERIRVMDPIEGTVYHVPPEAGELAGRMERMCRFANGEVPESYVHPVIRAIALHFCLAYDHPFIDGNGRAARALFYWLMLRQGYWLSEFISISSIVKKGPSRYSKAFLHTETDEGDLTYFLIHQLDVIRQAIASLQRYLKRKMRELRATEQILRSDGDLNHRQLALLSHALRHASTVYTIESHRRSQGVVYQTARSDLLGLVDRGLLDKQRVSGKFVFKPAAALSRLAKNKNR